MLNSIDLFAGCGGLTRGLEWAGFECLAFNELNKDAADSFALNFPDALRLDGDISEAVSQKVIEETLIPLIESKGGLDLLCGGPPCQGYSGIGHRRTNKLDKRDIPTNHLFHEMIRVITVLRPKVFLFENVEGILSGKWSLSGKKGEIFRDVWDEFSSISGYTAQPTFLHAYAYGVPQNRPRVMIMGIRNDVLEKTNIKPTPFAPSNLTTSYAFQLRNNGGFFSQWDEEKTAAPDLIDVLSDLDFEGWSVENPQYKKKPKTDFQKFLREGVQTDEKGRQILTDHEFSNHKPHVVERFQYMLDNNIAKKSDLPSHMRTKKFNQKPLPDRWEKHPTMTVTSLPDDYVHYKRPRTFSVREWARMQTFPDKHIFCGKRTTGGVRRAGNPSEGIWDREVPKYTQIGNAVPPILARGIGKRVQEIIQRNSKATNSDALGIFLESLSEDDFSIESEDMNPFQREELTTLFANPIFHQLLIKAINQHSREELQDPKKVSLIVKSFKKTADIVISNSLFKLAVRVVRKFTIGA
jgi:DNA (cytosine-5)-methyltransferase 1